MCKKMLILLVLALSVNLTFAVNNVFTGGGDGTSWDDASNWSLNSVPVSTDDSFIGYNGDNTDYDVTLDGVAVAHQFKVGIPETSGGSYALNVETGADFQLLRLFAGKRGTLNVNGGTFNLNANYSDAFVVFGGVVNVNDGLLTVSNAAWRILNDGGNTGTVVLNGGTFRIHNGTKFSNNSANNSSSNPQFTGKIDVRGGQLVMDGDCRTALQWHISNGNIVAYGSASGIGLELVYDSGTNTTTLTTPDANVWTASGDGSSWSDTANWSLNTLPVYNTDNSMLTYIGVGATTDYDVYIDGNARSGKAWLGRPEDPEGTYTLNLVDNAFYYLVRLYIGPKGVLNMDSGEFDTWEGVFAGSTININGGLFTVRSYLWSIPNGSSKQSVVTLNGGTFRIKNGTKFSSSSSDINVHNSSFTGLMDICGGQLVMDGDCRTALGWHIDNGNIIAYGGDSKYELQLVYDSGANTTTLSAVNVLSAEYLWPANGMQLTVDERYSFQLNWKPGRDAGELEGYNVYIADSNSVPLSLVSDSETPYVGETWQITNAQLGSVYSWRIDEVVAGSGEVITGDVWTVTIDDELLSVYEVLQDGEYHQLAWQWIACGDGNSWDDELNWHSEIQDKPIPAYNGYEGQRFSSRMDDTVINITGMAYGGNGWLGSNGLHQTVNIQDNGYWQLFRLYSYDGATINIGPGSSARWYILESIGTEINLEGNLRLTANYWKFKKSGSRGGVKLFDGELWIDNEVLPSSLPFNVGETKNIDIYEGVFKLDGDHASTMQEWVDAGYITAYGATEPNSIVDIYYDVDLNQTFVTARDDRRKAYQPYPTDGQQDIDVDDQLSWIVGDNVETDTLYLTPVQKADLNRDDYVGIDDFLILADNYLDESWLAIDIADITADNEINMRDFALMSSQWFTPFTLNEISTSGHDPNLGEVGPGELFSQDVSLNYDTKYIWRVDSNVKGETFASEAWSFTTGSDPMLAYNEYPVDGDVNIIDTTITLAWESDEVIDSCDVYFGESFSAVELADTSSSIYKASTSSGNWTTPALAAGNRYYWRIDTVDGAVTHKGKVWSFKVASTPMGLYVENGTLKLDGSEFKGYGVNYITAFTRTLFNPGDTSYEDGFAALAENNIPFVRMWASSYYVNNWSVYFEDKELYFELLDGVMASAQENGVGVVLSMFWVWYTLPDVVGESVTDWADPASETSKFMEQYIREIYERYQNCPAFWGWELGNEYNYSGESEVLAPATLGDKGHPTVRTEDDRTSIEKVRQIATNFANAVRKVDKNRFVTNGFGIRLDSTQMEYGTLPERIEDHQMVDVASIHYYATGSSTATSVSNAVTATDGWGKPLFVGEFGVSESNSLGFATVEAAYLDMLSDLQNAGVTFAALWVYDYENQNGSWNVTADNERSYMLDYLETANDALNQ